MYENVFKYSDTIVLFRKICLKQLSLEIVKGPLNIKAYTVRFLINGFQTFHNYDNALTLDFS